jgi:pilus assembly protein CpaD
MKLPTGKIILTALQVAGLAAGLGAAGCASTKDASYVSKTELDMHPIKVHQDSARLEIGVQPTDAALKPEDLRALKAFVGDYKDRGRGALVMSSPAGAANSDAAARIGAEVKRNLYDLLPSAGVIAEGAYTPTSDVPAPIVLSFERYVAEIKDCPSNGVTNAAVSWDNKPSAGFGCAINANIAMMLADPGDVVAPPEMGPSDAGRRSTVFDKYREGQPTGTQRSRDERGAISTAVNE